MSTTRRSFLAMAAAAPLAAALPVLASVPDLVPAPLRKPWVTAAKAGVSSLIWHLWDDPRRNIPAMKLPHEPFFVKEVLPWDGHGYPVVLSSYGFGWPLREETVTGYYDYEFCDFLDDTLQDSWHSPEVKDRYVNIHAFVREQRFGEDPAIMWATMEANHMRAPRADIKAVWDERGIHHEFI